MQLNKQAQNGITKEAQSIAEKAQTLSFLPFRKLGRHNMRVGQAQKQKQNKTKQKKVCEGKCLQTACCDGGA